VKLVRRLMVRSSRSNGGWEGTYLDSIRPVLERYGDLGASGTKVFRRPAAGERIGVFQ